MTKKKDKREKREQKLHRMEEQSGALVQRISEELAGIQPRMGSSFAVGGFLVHVSDTFTIQGDAKALAHIRDEIDAELVPAMEQEWEVLKKLGKKRIGVDFSQNYDVAARLHPWENEPTQATLEITISNTSPGLANRAKDLDAKDFAQPLAKTAFAEALEAQLAAAKADGRALWSN